MSENKSLIGDIGNINEDSPDDMKFRSKKQKAVERERIRQIRQIEAEQGEDIDPEELEVRLEIELGKARKSARKKVYSTKVNPKLYVKWERLAKRMHMSTVVAQEESMLAFLRKHGQEFEF